MPNQKEVTKEQSYTIYPVNGQPMNVKAASVKTVAKENRVYFLDAEGNPADEGIYILSGIVAIKPSGKASLGRYRM